MNKTIKNALILMAITLISGFLLGGVYELTKDARAKQQEKNQNEAYKTVFSQASTFEVYDYNKELIEKELEKNSITSKNVIVDGVVTAKGKDDKAIGYVVNVISKEGFGGDITFSVGIDLSGKINGVSILSISETAGLGMNAANESFLSQYKVERDGLFVVNKAENQAGTNIDALSGATITSKAVTKGVNAAVIVVAAILENTQEVNK